MYNPKQLYIYRRKEEWGATSIVFATAAQLIELYGQGHRHHRTEEQILEAAIRLSKAVPFTSMDQVQEIFDNFIVE